MSADLLRRAAAKLRAVVMELPEPWASRPWRTVQTDTESIDGIAACVNDHADDPYGAFDCCWSAGPIGHETVATIAALMHTPVALALAEWLEAVAVSATYHERDGFSSLVLIPGWKQAVATARAILREGDDDV